MPVGSTLGLVGENGAGKSTLMNILGGNLRPDTGSVLVQGQAYAPRHSQDAIENGMAFIHQELNLFSNLSIAENIFLTAFPKVGRGVPLINKATMRSRTAEYLEAVGLDIPPDTLVENLSAGERQLVEVAKALSIQARLIILDEPTTSLTARETQHLFSLLRQLRKRGVAMIYISHNLGEVLEFCDHIAVLRDGELVAHRPASEFNVEKLVSLMVGRSITQLFPPREAQSGTEVALEVTGLTQPGVVRGINLKLHCGEVLGLAGLMGSGRSELARILFGLDPCESGEIRVAGKAVKPSPAGSLRRRIAFLTENRREEGLCLEASISDNFTLVALPQKTVKPLGVLRKAELSAAISKMREAVRLTPSASNQQAVKTLSGGNQQKVVLGKWLMSSPRVFILDEPTRGIDVGAKYEIYTLINELTQGGGAVLVISSEIEELMGICDRILVMSRGEIRDELSRANFDRERILRAALQQA